MAILLLVSDLEMGHVMMFWSMRWEERSSQILPSSAFTPFERRPWKGKSIFCALDIVLPTSDIWMTAAFLQRSKESVLEWNSPWGWQWQRDEGNCILDDVTVQLTQPILLLACTSPWDNTLHYCVGLLEMGSCVLCWRSSSRCTTLPPHGHFHFHWKHYPLLCLWEGLGMELGWHAILVYNTMIITQKSSRGKHPRNHNRKMVLRHVYLVPNSLSLAFPICLKTLTFTSCLPCTSVVHQD